MSDDVRVISVSCNHCGAPLDAPAGTRFVTCTHCGSRLEVHRTGSATYTEVLENIDRRTTDIARDVDAIRRHSELEQLDREWSLRRETLPVRDRHGNEQVPSATGAVIGAVIAAAFGIFWTITASRAGAPGFFVAFGVVFVLLALYGGATAAGKASKLADEQRDYERRRARLLSELDRRGGDDGPADRGRGR